MLGIKYVRLFLLAAMGKTTVFLYTFQEECGLVDIVPAVLASRIQESGTGGENVSVDFSFQLQLSQELRWR